MWAKILTVTTVAILTGFSSSKNLPAPPPPPFQQSVNHQGRTYGNFGPSIPVLFEVLEKDLPTQIYIDTVDDARKYLAHTLLNGDQNEIQISSYHTSPHNHLTHYYFGQTCKNGIRITNANANLNVFNGTVQSIGSTLYKGPKTSIVDPSITAAQAIQGFADLLNLKTTPDFASSVSNNNVFTGLTFSSEPILVSLAYTQTNVNTLKLVWEFEVDMSHNHYKVCVDASTREVVFLMDYIADAVYNVLPIGLNDPTEGDREVLVNPEYLPASPLGWHSTGPEDSHTVTIGNNAFAQENHYGGEEYINKLRPSGGLELVFDNFLDWSLDPMDYFNASITQLFYMNNLLHDIFYMYGFNEVAGNFQEFNFELGGAGSDAVIVEAQYWAGLETYNGAGFDTRVDGSNSRMMMPLWDKHEPHRDVAFDTAVVVHEFLHGISTRLTGGRMNVECLFGNESYGMGEGWGDIFGIIFQTNENSTRDDTFVMGVYINGEGMRKNPYSTDLSVNPCTYRYVYLEGYEPAHAKGEVWASILFEVYWNLVEKHGFYSNWHAGHVGHGGNNIFIQLLIDSMKIQPCSPNFIQARDAILEADKINNNDQNYNELWAGFAKRGLGVGAEYPGIESFDVPQQ